METVEKQCEDVPHDMDVYVDEENHTYSFAYGMDFNGIINDERVKRYKVKWKMEHIWKYMLYFFTICTFQNKLSFLSTDISYVLY